MAGPSQRDRRARRLRFLRMAMHEGFAVAGVAPAAPSPMRRAVEKWLADRRHGTMHYLARHLPQRLDPRRLLPGARTVLCVADRYAASGGAAPPEGSGARGRLARYAWGADYHKTVKKRLHRIADSLRARYPHAVFRCATDTAPVLEHEHAARAGIGFTGKHTLTIHPRLGSWMVLGEIVTTLDAETAEEAAGSLSTEKEAPDAATVPWLFGDHFQGCGTCTRCIDACPTGCITPYRVDAERCISYLTIEHAGSIPKSLHAAMGDWVGGCDVCQEVCPFNEPARVESTAAASPERYTPRPPAPSVSLQEVLTWAEADREEAFRGSALSRIKLPMLKRNALIAAGNALREREDATLRRAVEARAEDAHEAPLVRYTARQVLFEKGT